jgi:hypothetical protein
VRCNPKIALKEEIRLKIREGSGMNAMLSHLHDVTQEAEYSEEGEGKVVPVLSLVPRHEDILESGGTGGGGQPHVPAALTPGEEPPVPI